MIFKHILSSRWFNTEEGGPTLVTKTQNLTRAEVVLALEHCREEGRIAAALLDLTAGLDAFSLHTRTGLSPARCQEIMNLCDRVRRTMHFETVSDTD